MKLKAIRSLVQSIRDDHGWCCGFCDVSPLPLGGSLEEFLDLVIKDAYLGDMYNAPYTRSTIRRDVDDLISLLPDEQKTKYYNMITALKL